MELLSPAGDFESLKAAVNNGADAVYFGGGKFNARRQANSPQDLKESVDYCHIRGCKVYFTLNTLILDREFKAFLELAYKAAQCGVDAYIVQDWGAGYALKREFPEIPLHASTQMTVTNSFAAKTLENLGYERIILARELTAPEIKTIHKSVGIPLEAFAHGALCQGYSGQCLMSCFLGGRSANRGECAQPCRLEYSIGEKDGNLLSTKDLCLVDYIEELKNCGVTSLKIEGRLKRAEYVAQVTRAYRRAIDFGRVGENEKENLKAVFNRGNFTTGKFNGAKQRLFTVYPGHIGVSLGKIVRVYSENNRQVAHVKTSREVSAGDMVLLPAKGAKPLLIKKSERIKDGFKLTFEKGARLKDRDELRLVYDKSLMDELASDNNIIRPKKPLTALVDIETDMPASLTITDREGLSVKVFGETVPRALNRAVSQDEIHSQISKTGDYPFYFEKIDIFLKGSAAYSKGALNALRRDGLAAYIQKLPSGNAPKEPDFDFLNVLKGSANRKVGVPKLAASVFTLEQVKAVENIVDIAYVPADTETCGLSGKLVIPSLKPVCGDSDIEGALPLLKRYNAALLTTPVEFDGRKIADYTFNVTNLFSLYALSELGYSRSTLSLELNAAQIRDLTRHSPIETEAVVYGKINLMVTANCPLDCGMANCKIESENVYLKDRMKKEFLLKKMGRDCKVAILNSVPIFMADKIKDVCADVVRLIFTDETPEDCAKIAQNYKNALQGGKAYSPQPNEFTRGNYYRGFNKVD